MLLGYALTEEGEFGKEMFWSQTLRSWKTWTRQKSGKPGRVRNLSPQRGENFIFSDADGTAELSGRDYEFRQPTPRREQLVRSEDLSGETQGESGK